jgi:hypothetical protein
MSLQVDGNKKEYLKHLETSLGIISDACNAMGISRTIVYRWRNEDGEFNDAILEVQEQFAVDHVESKLVKKINEGDAGCIMFYLNNRAKHRGYNRNTQTESSNQHTVTIIHKNDE